MIAVTLAQAKVKVTVLAPLKVTLATVSQAKVKAVARVTLATQAQAKATAVTRVTLATVTQVKKTVVALMEIVTVTPFITNQQPILMVVQTALTPSAQTL